MLNVLPTVECSCETCKGMCRRVSCWPTPMEALALILEGHAEKMMKDYWNTDCGAVYVIAPASKGYGGEIAPHYRDNLGCEFHNAQGLCDIHHMKPIEGRVADCQKKSGGVREEIADLWDTPDGRDVVRIWEEMR